jgi:hypothetical protein
MTVLSPRGSVLESITCPGCQKTIRIPHDVLGQRAQCPFCKCHFRAPQRTAGGLTEPQLLRRNPLSSRLTFAGTLLLFVGLMGVLSNAVQAVQILTDFQSFEAETARFFNQLAEREQDAEGKDRIQAQVPLALKYRPVVIIASGVLSLVTVAAAVAMLRRRSHGLAVLGSFVAMFNVANLCCCGCIFVGGYALYVVLNPAVRAEFQARTTG